MIKKTESHWIHNINSLFVSQWLCFYTLLTTTAAAASAFRLLCYIFVRILVKFGFASCCAKIVFFAFIIARMFCIFFIYFHFTNRVYCHYQSPAFLNWLFRLLYNAFGFLLILRFLHFLTFKISQRSFTRQSSNPSNIISSLGHGNCTTCLEHIKYMRAFYYTVITRIDQSLF